MYFLYLIIIYPIEKIIEIIFVLLQKFFHDPGFSIIGISICINFLTLPLYHIAEKWQQLERNTQKQLKPNIDRIKAVFSGDEQYMILSTYYKQNHYHPMYALRSSIGLLIQVPFFIAAYNFLSNLDILQGQSFLFIHNLAMSDELLSFGTFHINVLPIIMTLINIIAGIIYTKGFTKSEKIQLYAMAFLFLVLLYNSPSALVIYWTLNNIFSLIKNIVYKTKKPLRIVYIGLCSIFTIFLLYGLFSDISNIKKVFIALITMLIYISPLLIRFYNYFTTVFLYHLQANDSKRNMIFFLTCILLCIFVGIIIPSNLVATSPQEFSYVDSYTHPYQLIIFTLFQSIGYFLFYPIILYFLFDKKLKVFLTVFFTCLLITGIVNNYFFSYMFGTISNILTFEKNTIAVNFFITTIINILMICIIAYILSSKKIIYVPSVMLILLIACIIQFTFSTIKINKTFSKLQQKHSQTILDTVFTLSKIEPNVFIIMLDRATAKVVPYIFNDNQHLFKQFSGFEWYQNTVSYSGHTLMGAPPLFGGFEYTPDNINKRNTEALVDKHNESIRMLPTLFADNGFTSIITDASWANYSWIPDNTIFNTTPEITAINLEGNYTDIYIGDQTALSSGIQSELLKRNFLFFSFFKILPPILRNQIYDDGDYLANSSANFIGTFIDSFAVLHYLPHITTVKDNYPKTFSFHVNNATHDPIFLQYPEYLPAQHITDYGINMFTDDFSLKSYQATVAAFLQIGDWLEYLKTQEVYDNTRIIIIADHGNNLKWQPQFTLPSDDLSAYNPLFLMKDFNTAGTIVVNKTFTTNADLPYFAAKDLIESPKNPFTQRAINKEDISNGIYVINNTLAMPDSHNRNTFNYTDKEYIYIPSTYFTDELPFSDLFEPSDHNTNTFKIQDDQIMTVKENIFNISNWSNAKK